MKKTLRGKLTYANVISSLCLFLLLGGGTAFAATLLTKNSVGSKQIKKGAVTPVKLSKAAKSALTGAPGKEGPRGEKGAQGEPGPLTETLPSGKTERGMYVFASTRSGSYTPNVSISFPLPVTFTPTIQIIKTGESSTTNCPGSGKSPTAKAGYLCIYETRRDTGTLGASNEVSEGRYGAALQLIVGASENYEFEGTWAITAP